MPRVVLYQPQIPPNTGNVARTCAATGSELHLIEPLGFTISDRHLRRAGLDYWPWVSLQLHADLACFLAERQRRGGRLIALSSQVEATYTEFRFRNDDWLLFGRETDGLPNALQATAEARLTIPMARRARQGEGGVRSLNLSVSVGIVLFEALRQLGPDGGSAP
ncbi:tRNA (cytidine(34)-2'-O)-methyltransferase [Cyanobium sp. Cruz CV13-4-11]|jgi:tRNA (cytidine/uridine-2'-O-)-methyltransferase|uniref:tRNA (cytidine(34)-2'-O)-methyltransferase n=1 Tax=unclassified Cyanobium TaxID=2627006 RepID=UPI0020CEDD91|nr:MULTISPECIES: tRNA (cytidine(34)-2'-O)-methyltransferase [unclassified Cyanobium]MCP9899074.1 tRNA (cytidine(34)-2'-O)-methyltransferase [Cyanobium sp. Cruz CV11-17]MCP9918180.1 tRNA (cytidine(34)-2'-O)-methyltransferase [Cyanobium sp. Cruz CV13-4-11]